MVSVLFQTICMVYSVVYNCLLVDGVIPVLKVQKVNNKLIERKRQDTLEICRLFNEENIRKTIINNTNNEESNKDYPTRHRKKRDIHSNKIDNPILDQKDIIRVENIVDKLYDDLEQDGDRITYRQRKFKNVTESVSNKQNRRFNFAPAQLLGPLEEIMEKPEEKLLVSESVKIPWIKKWKHGIVPYFIDSNTYDSVLSDIILKAFEYIEKVSCIRLQRLREKPTDKQSMQNVEWLYITNPSAIRQCVHSNERKPNTGVQMVVFGYECLSQGEIAHEVMHLLGFAHEHTRSDRDRYITILWDNIKPGYKKYFETRHYGPLLSLPYDYASVLHYPPRAFSKNGQVTVMVESGFKVGQREVLSELDIEKIGMVYGLECVERNKDYLIKTCPSVIKMNPKTTEVTSEEIQEYFKDRVWPYGIINYKIKDKVEFTTEEIDNMKAVFSHIEKETCIEFRDINDQDEIDDDVNSSASTVAKPEKEEDEKNQENTTHIKNELFTIVTENPKKLKITITLSNVTSLSDIKLISDQATRRAHTVLPKSPARRHAANMIMLVRSAKAGCQCPPAGRPNGNKELPINADCFNSVNDLLHLFVHMLGLEHQHNMHDRDSFLHIIWNNLTSEIRQEMKDKLPPAASAGFAYDYQSVMHYPWLQIKDGVSNIMYPIWNDGWAMGHWQGLSWADVQKINLIYMNECEKRKQHTNNV